MSENENQNMSGSGSGSGNGSGTNRDAGGTGGAGGDWGWEPVPHGGEYDSDATAFVQLPQDMLDALDSGEPLAAPGHGYVPPPMIVPLGSASADPAATGTWTMPVRWPEAGTPATGDTGAHGPVGGPGRGPVGGPIPASIPLPPSVAAAFGEPAAAQADPDSGATAEWRFPEAAQQPSDESTTTGQWALPTFPDQGDYQRGGALDSDWSQAPATLPGGAAAPWADAWTESGELPPRAVDAGSGGPEGLLSSGVLPADSGQNAAQRAGGAGAGPGRGPRVLGGPGVGTPLPPSQPLSVASELEPEGALHAAPDIDAAHGPAPTPVEGERPRPVDAEGAGLGDGHGFAETLPAPAEAGAAPTPDEGAADSGVTPPDEGIGEGFPAQEPTYEDEGIPAAAHHEHPSASYVLRVNGADRPVTGAWIGESLLYVLRERLGLAGAKDGCSQGECGACAVQVDGRLVASCLVPAATAAGSEVRTVEGLATDGELSDVQQALCRSGAVQCGFCVPGMAMTIHDLLSGNHAPSTLETRQALCGNLCRCSGYKGVLEAVREVVAERDAASSGTGSGSGSAFEDSSPAEPRIPHQAPPGEGGIHGMPGGHGMPGNHGNHGNHGIDHNGGMV
ncbi:(2Fe-2S)-binding protein [Streptomyces sp. NPDC003042]